MVVASATSEKSQRFNSIDAVRGAAMLFVFLSHFTAAYPWSSETQEAAGYLRSLSMIASPTFVIVSGMVAGFLASTNPEGFDELRVKLFDRGVFLLVVGHLLLTLALVPSPGRFFHDYQTSLITDAIAIAIMVGPSIVVLVPAHKRIALTMSIFAISWWLIVYWQPHGTAVAAKLYLVGRVGAPGELSAISVFPAAPWFAVYLAGTIMGERLGSMYVEGNRQRSHFLLAGFGGVCFAAASALYAIARALHDVSGPTAFTEMNRVTFLSIYGKFPPGIVYLGFFGGAGTMMLALILELDRQKKFIRVFDELRKLGRSSLFIFTVQYALYRAFLPRLGFHYTPFWPLIFLASVFLLTLLAELWDGHSTNRYLTLGITAQWRRHQTRRSAGHVLRSPAIGPLERQPLTW